MRPGVIGIVYLENQIVLVKRRDIPIWVLPGGGIDAGETPEQAIIREIKEETGLTAKIRRKSAEYTPLNHFCAFTHVYECDVTMGVMTVTEETCDIGAFSVDETPSDFFFLHKDWLIDSRERPFELVSKPIHQITYFSVLMFFFKRPQQVLRALLARLGFPINTK